MLAERLKVTSNRRLPSLKSLHFFNVAGQKLSFKQAAIELNVSQAAVSQQIRHLEEQIDCKLFFRGPKQVSLTEQGRMLLPYLQRGFSEFEQGLQAITGDSNPNVLKISALHSFTTLFLLPRLPSLQQLYPELSVQLAPSNFLVDFDKQDIDVGLRMGEGNYADVDSIKLFDEQLVLVASPQLVQNIDINDAKQVFKLPWLEDTMPAIQTSIDALCQQFAVDRKSLTPLMKTDNAIPLIEGVLFGQGMTLINRSFVHGHLNAGRMVKLLDYTATSNFSLYLVAPKGKLQWPKVQTFMTWLQEQLAAEFDWLS